MKRMKNIALAVAMTVAIPVASVFVMPSDAQAEIRSETKKAQDAAEKKGRENAQARKSGKGKPSAEKDGYRDMSDGEKEAYKRGYRKGQ